MIKAVIEGTKRDLGVPSVGMISTNDDGVWLQQYHFEVGESATGVFKI